MPRSTMVVLPTPGTANRLKSFLLLKRKARYKRLCQRGNAVATEIDRRDRRATTESPI
jgi:hypothetical protein